MGLIRPSINYYLYHPLFYYYYLMFLYYKYSSSIHSNFENLHSIMLNLLPFSNLMNYLEKIISIHSNVSVTILSLFYLLNLFVFLNNDHCHYFFILLNLNLYYDVLTMNLKLICY
jgi:hypothetical protein